ncbi:hypothetical protein [Pantoea sp. At-9b]|uniref:hypothetical protein n=1 Tax=Pantoea sp. (strain At-9b) TaxID=592316 RepID=UPI00030C9091|nr:hypothetical protein [Pantoea sp. At-9b]
MSKPNEQQLTFRPASELPTAELRDREVLILNPCDGYHIGYIKAFEENGEVYDVGIYTWLGKEFEPHDFYVAWALLPNIDDRDSIIKLFEGAKG